MPFPARNRHRKIAELQAIQNDNHPFLNDYEPRLKTEPYVKCFLFFSFSKSTLKESLLSDGHFQSINAGYRTTILVFTWFILQY